MVKAVWQAARPIIICKANKPLKGEECVPDDEI